MANLSLVLPEFSTPTGIFTGRSSPAVAVV